MKVATLIARILLGLIFVVFGLNKFLNFIPSGPMPTGLAGQFIGALYVSHYLWVIAIIEIGTGILLLINQYVPLALVLNGGVVVNIFLYHAFFDPKDLPLPILVVILWLIIYKSVRPAFAGIFVQKA
jgi:putative oxidoreductase